MMWLVEYTEQKPTDTTAVPLALGCLHAAHHGTGGLQGWQRAWQQPLPHRAVAKHLAPTTALCEPSEEEGKGQGRRCHGERCAQHEEVSFVSYFVLAAGLEEGSLDGSPPLLPVSSSGVASAPATVAPTAAAS